MIPYNRRHNLKLTQTNSNEPCWVIFRGERRARAFGEAVETMPGQAGDAARDGGSASKGRARVGSGTRCGRTTLTSEVLVTAPLKNMGLASSARPGRRDQRRRSMVGLSWIRLTLVLRQWSSLPHMGFMPVGGPQGRALKRIYVTDNGPSERESCISMASRRSCAVWTAESRPTQ